MGRAKDQQISPYGVYRDEPDQDNAVSTSSAVPLRDRVALDDEPYHPDDDRPPAYSADFVGNRDDSRSRRDSLDYLPDEVLSIYPKHYHQDAKGSKSTVLSSRLTSDPEALRDYMLFQSRTEPGPWVRMLGTHTETRRNNKKEEKIKVTDFDIKIALSGLVLPSSRRTTTAENAKQAYRGGRIRTVAPGFRADVEASHVAPVLDEWYHRFCASSARVKTFTITRRIQGLDNGYLLRSLTELLRSTNYRGHISVTFPVDDRATTVMSDHFINRYRSNKYIWWVCVILQLWIITWPVIWLMTKRWDVLSSRWQCAVSNGAFSIPRDYFNLHDDPGWLVVQDNPPSAIGRRHREPNDEPRQKTTYINRSNRSAVTAPVWFETWKRAIVRAAESRTQQILTVADRNAAQAVEEQIGNRARERASDDDQGGFVGTAAGLIRGVGSVLRDAEMARGWGGDT